MAQASNTPKPEYRDRRQCQKAISFTHSTGNKKPTPTLQAEMGSGFPKYQKLTTSPLLGETPPPGLAKDVCARHTGSSAVPKQQRQLQICRGVHFFPAFSR